MVRACQNVQKTKSLYEERDRGRGCIRRLDDGLDFAFTTIKGIRQRTKRAMFGTYDSSSN